MKKNLKKLAAIAIAVVMMMAMMVPALAVELGTGSGKITVSNASKGITYEIVKLFDATLPAGTATTTTQVAYTLPANATWDTGLDTWFSYDANTRVITGKDVLKDVAELPEAARDALQAYATKNAAVLGTKSAPAAGTTLVFDNIPYGYYLLKAGSDAIVSIDSTHPTVDIVDKNDRTPSWPTDGKTIVDATGDRNVQVGDEVEYQIKYNTVNWIDNNGTDEKVFNYIFTDNFANGALSTPTSVTVKVVPAGATAEQIAAATPLTLDSDYKYDDTAKTVTVYWTNGEHTANDASIYDNGSIIVITYTATVLTPGSNGRIKNTVTANYNSKTEGGSTTDEEVFSYGFDLAKTTSDNQLLADAQFKLYYMKDGAKVYLNFAKSEDGLTYTVSTADTGTVDTIVTLTTGAIAIKGLDSDVSYKLEETVAPHGYNKLANDADVTGASFKDGHNVATITDGVWRNGGERVVNQSGVELPSTGGIGTTIFTVVGGILMVGAAVLFITKKRSEDAAQ